MADTSHIDAIEEEYHEIEKNKAWNIIYMKVRADGTYNDLSCTTARTAPNNHLNRYRDVLPYDHSRIVLEGTNTDYINASLVEVSNIGRKYILCQGPLSQTTAHFWLMVWQQKTKGIVMLNKVMEKNQIKCHQYWPLGEKRGGYTSSEYRSVNLKLDLLKEISHSYYTYRSFRLTNTVTNESREILHFHYTTWPDFGVPQSPEAFFKFLNVVRSSQCLEPQFGPPVIHCSAGIGRSGTFCLVDSVLKMLAEGLCQDESGKIVDVLLDMRRFRMGLIQTPDQLRFSYQAIVYGAHRINEINGEDPSEGSSCDEISAEEPPPLPPPRTDSLSRAIENQLPSDGDDTDSESDELEDNFDNEVELTNTYQRNYTDNVEAPSLPLPTEPKDEDLLSLSSDALDLDEASPSNPEDTSPNSRSEVRQRRQDQKAMTAAKVKEMREKARSVEAWQEFKEQFYMPFSLCAAFLCLGIGSGLFFYYRNYQT